ncbi:MAG: PAQR family membrane homeostasis protein TrhA [Desulfobacterales bacterium]|jgi:hemolysin III
MRAIPIAASYTAAEEIANSITHGIGVLLAIAGTAVLISSALRDGGPWHVAGVVVFGVGMVLLYASSMLYHSIHRPRIKAVLRILDHSAIYILIAGTYTPFTLVNLRGSGGWVLFGAVWGLAVVGILLEVAGSRRLRGISLILYLAMGWSAVAAFKPMMASVAPGGLVLVLAGGLAYTLGIVFYAWHSLRHHHAVWHVFVLAGSACHFFAVLHYVVPIPLPV